MTIGQPDPHGSIIGPTTTVCLRAPIESDREAFVALRQASAESLRPSRSCIFGDWIGDPSVGRGYGTAGYGRVWTACAHEDAGGLGPHRVEADMISTGRASLALARRVGMRKEGFSPRYLEIDGEWWGRKGWAITVEEREAAADLQQTAPPGRGASA